MSPVHRALVSEGPLRLIAMGLRSGGGTGGDVRTLTPGGLMPPTSVPACFTTSPAGFTDYVTP